MADEIYKWKYGKATKQMMSALFHFTTWMLPIMHAIIRVLKYFCCFP